MMLSVTASGGAANEWRFPTRRRNWNICIANIDSGYQRWPAWTSGTCHAKLRSSKPIEFPNSTAFIRNSCTFCCPPMKQLGCKRTRAGADTTK